MNQNKDYYAILGVLPTAEDVVIRAAYKALAQRYHPDRYSGSAEEATEIMKNINKAYQVLSDPIKRKEYDSQSKTEKATSYEPEEEEQYEEYAGDDPLDYQWKMAVDYYPYLANIDKRLHNISSKLAYTFRAYILYEKKFKEGKEIASVMEDTFLETYFGSNEKIIKFAKKVILDGNKKAARELNKVIKLLGTDADAELVIEKIRRIYYPEYFEAQEKRKKAGEARKKAKEERTKKGEEVRKNMLKRREMRTKEEEEKRRKVQEEKRRKEQKKNMYSTWGGVILILILYILFYAFVD